MNIMGDKAPWFLGGLRRWSFTPVPPPVTVTVPSPYYGHSRINATSLSATIGFIEDPNGQEAPVSVAAYANIAIAGTRRLTTKPLNGYEHCHTVWTLTKGDGTAIAETFDGIKNYRYNPATQLVEGSDVNVHTDTISPEFTDLLLNHGDYKLKLEVYAMTHTGECLLSTAEYSFTVAKPTNNHIYIDPVGGLDTNDGLHPLLLPVPSGGWNLNYVESTGVLSQTGAFTGLVLDDEQYDTDTANFIYLTGFGRARIAEVIDANSVRIDDRWKLGSDQTGLTSSNGPKQSIVYVATNNTEYHYKASEINLTSTINFEQKTGQCGLWFYGGRGILKSDTLAATSTLVKLGAANGTIPAKTILSNVDLDAQYIQNNPIFAGIGMTNPANHYRHILRHVVQKNAQAGTIYDPGQARGGSRLDVLMWGGNLDNKRENEFDTKSLSLYADTNEISSLRQIGVISDADGEATGTHHHFYIDGYSNHYHAAWIYFRYSSGVNCCFNINTKNGNGEWTRNYFSIHDCYMQDSGTGLDFSNSTNIAEQYQQYINVARIQADVESDFATPRRAKSAFFTNIDHRNQNGAQSTAVFNITAEEAWNYVIQNVRAENVPFIRNNASSCSLEAFDNEITNLTTEAFNYFIRDLVSTGEKAFVDNKFYAPNAPNTDHYQIDGVRGPLSTLNALTLSSGNTEEVIAWADWPPTESPSRLYLNPPNDTAALISFDVGDANNRIYDGQGLRFKIITSDVTTSFGGGLAINSSNYFRFRPLLNAGNGSINIMQSAGFSQTAEFFINLPSQDTLWDGVEHVVKMPVTANAEVTINIEGTSYTHATVTFGPTPQFDFTYLRGGGAYYIYDLEVYDVATDATIMLIPISSGTLIGTEAATVGTGTLTLNVAEGDWTDTPT